MALISASTILTSLCLFHITLSYFFYTNPHRIADQALVWVLGEAMGLPETQYFSTRTPATSLLAVLLFLLGLSDLITLSMPEQIWLVHHWGTQAPARMLVFGALAIFTYVSAPSVASRHTVTVANGLCNRVVFTFACLEVLSWFWAWVTLREEAALFLARKRRRSSGGLKER
ncbi:increased loss of mitochondrial DNA protein 1 [Xylaria nigripes]|nr:increased loss of mitochondrial DNA protein 1 [Xylaria nigripes]